MTIEQEFFEAFGIEPVYYAINKEIVDHPLYIKDVDLYPPITSEIVLKLEEIFIDFDRIELVRINKIMNLKTMEETHEYIYVLDENTFTADNRKDALLLMCMELKDEIQEEVRGLFINNKQNGVTI